MRRQSRSHNIQVKVCEDFVFASDRLEGFAWGGSSLFLIYAEGLDENKMEADPLYHIIPYDLVRDVFRCPFFSYIFEGMSALFEVNYRNQRAGGWHATKVFG